MTERILKALRAAFGEALPQLGEAHPNLVVLDADISASLNTGAFTRRFPDRHINFGVAEQNMLMGAAGMASLGLVPLACTYATFASMRACEQLRSYACYANLPVKIVASHGGIEVGWDGPTHQAIEDLAIMRAMPNMTVIVPADAASLPALLEQAINIPGPAYLRMGRNPVPVIYPAQQKFEVGKAVRLAEGQDVLLVACGVMVSTALEALELLATKGIHAGLLDMHTLKPLDAPALLAAAKDVPLVVSLEDHNNIGGLGSAVAESLAENLPRRVVRIGIPDRFAESGDPALLFRKFGMDAASTADRVTAELRQPGLPK